LTRIGSIFRSTLGRTIAALAAVVSAVLIAGVGPATAAPDAARTVAPDYRKALADSQAAIGRPLLDVAMRDHNGKSVRFSDFAGKPLLISLVYTGCFQACPVATQFLAQAVRTAREALGDDRFRIVSIGFNQPFDDPAAMAAFRKQNGIDDRDWHFLSPDPAQVDALTANLGFTYEATPKGFDHVTQVTVVDADGLIYRQVYGESFDLPMLVQPLKELLSGQASRELTLENVWEKVKLYCTVYDIFAGLTTLGAMAWFVVRGLRNPNRA